MSEVGEINDFMAQMGDDIEVIWGVTFDDELGEKVKVTLLATGSEMSVVPEDLREELRIEREAAKASPDADDSEQGEETLTLTNSTQIKQPKTDDLMDAFRNKLYGTPLEEESKASITLDQFDNDDELLRQYETEPAINRR